jgi:hypothetical protein
MPPMYASSVSAKALVWNQTQLPVSSSNSNIGVEKFVLQFQCEENFFCKELGVLETWKPVSHTHLIFEWIWRQFWRCPQQRLTQHHLSKTQ